MLPPSILIVEDEFIIAMLYERQLKKLGYHVAGKVSHGQQAIEMVRSGGIDAILMDIKILGEWDGIETMERIRTFSAIPVVYVTGNSDADTRKRATETSPVAYLIKPVELNVLAESLALAVASS